MSILDTRYGLPKGTIFLKTKFHYTDIQTKALSSRLRSIHFIGNIDFTGYDLKADTPYLSHLLIHKINVENLPKTLVKLHLRDSPPNPCFSQFTKLKYLKITNCNGTIQFSKSILSLHLGHSFDAKIKTWPDIQILKVTQRNFSFYNTLPSSLIYLCAPFEPYSSFQNKIPNVVHLIVRSIVNQDLSQTKLQYIKCEELINFILPLGLISLVASYIKDNSGSTTNYLLFPQTLRKLKICYCDDDNILLNSIKSLPLTHLMFNSDHLEKSFHYSDYKILSLTHFKIYQNVTSISNNITHLSIHNFQESYDTTLLQNTKITHLRLLHIYEKTILPDTLISLDIININDKIPRLPTGLKKLNIHSIRSYDLPLLPPYLTHLALSYGSDNQPILPKSLVYLKVPYNFLKDIPKTIKMVVLITEKNRIF